MDFRENVPNSHPFLCLGKTAGNRTGTKCKQIVGPIESDSSSSSDSEDDPDNEEEIEENFEPSKTYRIPKKGRRIWDAKQIENLRKNFKNIEHLDDNVLAFLSFRDISANEGKKDKQNHFLTEKLAENYEKVRKFAVKVEAGEDSCTERAHDARFLRGYVGNSQDLRIQACRKLGIAGLVPIVKLAGAAAATVDSLDELARIATKANDMTRSVGVSMSPGSIPATGHPTFEIDDDKIGLGMGIHGEKGVGLIPMTTADDLVPKLLDLLFKDDLAFNQGDEVVLLVNSLGSTTMMELLIVNRTVKKILADRGLKVHDTIIGPLVTCQEMSGFSISLTKLDPELKRLWDLSCESVCYTKLGNEP